MLDLVKSLQARLAAFQASVRKTGTKHLNRTRLKEDIRSFVHDYFGASRPELLTSIRTEEVLNSFDSLMQDLLRATQGRTLVGRYAEIFRGASKRLRELELTILTMNPDAQEKVLMDQKETLIIGTLKQLSASAAASFEQGLKDLTDSNRSSWRGTVVEFRETLRETLDAMAPDEAVKSSVGFKLEPNTSGPTMKQKVIFILKSRNQKEKQVKATANAVEVTDSLVGTFVRSVYGSSSASTHGSATREEALRVRDFVSLSLVELLEIRG